VPLIAINLCLYTQPSVKILVSLGNARGALFMIKVGLRSLSSHYFLTPWGHVASRALITMVTSHSFHAVNPRPEGAWLPTASSLRMGRGTCGQPTTLMCTLH
jgi:hypothetical protein